MFVKIKLNKNNNYSKLEGLTGELLNKRLGRGGYY
jgi:hypothetical protein